MKLLAVENIGKAYVTYTSELRRIGRWFGLPSAPTVEKWVIKNISFTIQSGESVGILGKNGAGKSTLLKIIAGTLPPSEGRITLNGSVAAILELGMGFNPELTGRLNVIYSAGLMGFSQQEISQILPEVERFADIAEYFDQPLRTYSSGMGARLAFALATSKRPDLLIIDEVLSVGDDGFRRKCFARIESYLSLGTSLLLVTHSAEQIRRFCTRAIYLDGHQLIADGDPKTVCAQYEKSLFSGLIEHRDGLRIPMKNDALQQSSTVGLKAYISQTCLLNSNDKEVNLVPTDSPIKVRITIKFEDECSGVSASLGVKTTDGVRVYAAIFKNIMKRSSSKGQTIFYEIEFNVSLLPGAYFITLGLFEDALEGMTLIHQLQDEIMFRVFATNHSPNKTEIGIADLNAKLLRTEVLL